MKLIFSGSKNELYYKLVEFITSRQKCSGSETVDEFINNNFTEDSLDEQPAPNSFQDIVERVARVEYLINEMLAREKK